MGDDLVLCHDAARVLANIMGGDDGATHAVRASGGVEHCLNFITPPRSTFAVGSIKMEARSDDGVCKEDRPGVQGQLCIECVWLVGNVAGATGAESFRDALIALGAVDRFTTLLHSWIGAKGYQSLECLRQATWAATILVRGEPHPDGSKAEPLLGVFARLTDAKDPAVASNVAWGLVYMSKIDELHPVIAGLKHCWRRRARHTKANLRRL